MGRATTSSLEGGHRDTERRHPRLKPRDLARADALGVLVASSERIGDRNAAEDGDPVRRPFERQASSEEREGDVLLDAAVAIGFGESGEGEAERGHERPQEVARIRVEASHRSAVVAELVGAAAVTGEPSEHDDAPRLVERVIEHEAAREPAGAELLLLGEEVPLVAGVVRSARNSDARGHAGGVDATEATGQKNVDVADA